MSSASEPITLRTLFSEFPLHFAPQVLPEIPIHGISIDSRKIFPGSLFIARRGGSLDGHMFIPDAIHAGAVAVVGEQDLKGLTVPYIRVDDSIPAVTWLAAAFYGWPGRNLIVIGVTGTDGKTTTCNLLYHILISASMKVGMISTVNAIIGDQVLDTGLHVTTPDAVDVQHYLSRMVKAGLTHVILETTSHGLSQHRVDASQYDIAVITNITHEHLDQHGSYEKYREAKARLFALLSAASPKKAGNPRLAVLNKDDSSFDFLSAYTNDLPSVRCVNYGLDSSADFHAENIEISSRGIQFTVVGPDGGFPVASSLVGEYNVSNCLAALAAAVRGLGVNPVVAVRGIAGLGGVTGRMERIDLGQPFTALVDFAHTPNALRVTLEAARRLTNERIIVLFGSAGLRDKEKRTLMAETALGLADISILTAEDPRSESLEDILAEMAAGAVRCGGVEGRDFFCIPDRRQAMRFAVRLADKEDIVLACGKGHEQSMCFGDVEYPWDDRTAMRAALSELMDLPGPVMPYLPGQESQDSNSESEWSS